MTLGLALFSLAIVLYMAVALKLGYWSISAPLVFVACGFLLGPNVLGLVDAAPDAEQVKGLTELTLALLLFADASTVSLRQVREDAQLPARLLSIGIILTIALGTVLGVGLLPQEGLAFAALIGTILAPTDAALGLPIVNNRRVPARIRRALNVESGLNDGIVTPFVALFLAYALATEEQGHGNWLATALADIALAIAVGSVVGVLGGWLLTRTTRRGWTSGGSEKLAMLGLALCAYVGALSLHGNGFIAAFVGGTVFGAATRERFAEPTEFTETFSTFLSLLVWGLFGAVFIPSALRFTTDWRPIAYAVLSLTIVRMLPVALALMGTHLRADTVALIGWFGPRGLASVVFTLLAYTEFTHANRSVDTLVAVTTWTVLLSVLAHGLSAGPLASWYARRLMSTGGVPAELVETPEVHERHSILGGPLDEKEKEPGAPATTPATTRGTARPLP